MSKIKLFLFLAILASTSAISCWAQTTNPPPATALESVETTAGNLVLKSSMPLGSINAGPAVISLTCKQDDIINPATNTRSSLYGCSLTINANGNGQIITKTLIDADELDSLLQSVNYIRNVSWSITALPAFNMFYATKAGLIISGFSSKRNGQIEFSIRTGGLERSIVLTVDQVGQLYSLLQSAKAKIDDLRKD